MAPKEAKVTWMTSTRSYEEIEAMTPDDEHASFDLGKPESSAWVKDILKEATCDDPERRVCALWRFKDVFPELVQEQGFAKAAECASYMLQRGLLKELHAGLADARATGQWLFRPALTSSIKGTQLRILLINRVTVYATVIAVTVVDERTAKFFLNELEGLLKLLEATFYQAQHPSAQLSLAERAMALDPAPRTEARLAIVRAVSVLVDKSEKAKRFMTKRKDFCLSMIQEAAKVLDESCNTKQKREEFTASLYSSLKLVINLSPLYTARERDALLDDTFSLAARSLTQSDSMPVLHNAVMVLAALQIRTDILPKLRQRSGVLEAFRAVAACTEYPRTMRTVAANFAFATAEILVPDNEFTTEEEQLGFFEVLAALDPAVKRRLERLVASERHPHSRALYRRYKRKCSNPACENVEGSEKFKACRGCMLEIYCGADCQKAAWKAGHRDTCPRKDRQSSKKG